MAQDQKQVLLDELQLLDNTVAELNLKKREHLRLDFAAHKLRTFIEEQFKVQQLAEPTPPPTQEEKKK